MHSHQFVENYDGLVGFGLNRETDEKTLMVYLQKLADDQLAEVMVRRMSDGELQGLFDSISDLLQQHLTEPEYHTLFLKDREGDH
ncbi:MAG: cytoplasmic protein [Desulfobacterales bacterium]|jgi:hypothetical protein